MNDGPPSLELLRSVNPVTVDRSLLGQPAAQALLERIFADEHRRPPVRPAEPQPGPWNRFRLRLLTGSAVTAVVAAVIVLALTGSTAAPAFAGWSETPSPSSYGHADEAVRGCGALVPLKIVDTRGPYTAAVFGGPDGGVACLRGPGMSFAATIGDVATSGDQLPATRIQALADVGSDSRGDAFVLLAGRVGTAVEAVSVVGRNGEHIAASVHDGWYLAWWPAATHAVDAEVVTRHGRYTQGLPLFARSPSLPCAHQHDAVCAGVGGSTGAAALLAGPPMIGQSVAKPFGSKLLFAVYSASQVHLCVHLGAAPESVPLSSPPASNCEDARLVTSLPRGYHGQRNLLEFFPGSLWIAELPHRVGPHGRLVAFVTASGLGSKSRLFGEVTVTW